MVRMTRRKGFTDTKNPTSQLALTSCKSCGTLMGEWGKVRDEQRCSYCVEKDKAFRRGLFAK